MGLSINKESKKHLFMIEAEKYFHIHIYLLEAERSITLRAIFFVVKWP